MESFPLAVVNILSTAADGEVFSRISQYIALWMGKMGKSSASLSQMASPASATSARIQALLRGHGSCIPADAALSQHAKSVYILLTLVPAGKVTTYGALAQALSSSSRAVGQALRRNPYAPRIPCHRVIKSDLSIGGFCGRIGDDPEILRKLQMLHSEGVEFAEGRLQDRKYLQLEF